MNGKGLTLEKIAAERNKRKVSMPRGGPWDHSSVGPCAKAPAEVLLHRGWQLHGDSYRDQALELFERRGRYRLLNYGLLMVETPCQSNRS